MTLPDIPVFTESIHDEAPPTSYEYACQDCGKELFYSGRGRKPKYCEEHKPNRGSTSGSSTKVTGKSQQLAAQATEALVQINSLAAVGLMLTHMTQTAGALAGAQDGFRETTYAALLTDPELCKTILKAGTTSGKVALVISYGMLGAAVVPVGILEYKQGKAAREAAQDEDRTDSNEPTSQA